MIVGLVAYCLVTILFLVNCLAEQQDTNGQDFRAIDLSRKLLCALVWPVTLAVVLLYSRLKRPSASSKQNAACAELIAEG